MALRFLFLVMLLLSGRFAIAQEIGPSSPIADYSYESGMDSLIGRYLSNTRNTKGKIREIVEASIAAEADPSRREQLMPLFQIGLTLAPYVRDAPELLADLYGRFAKELHRLGATQLSIGYLKTSYAILRGNRAAPSINSYSNVGSIGSLYLGAGKYDSAYLWFRTGLEEAARLPEKRWLAAANNNMGIVLAKLKAWEQAQKYYNNALTILFSGDASADSGLVISIRDNLAELALERGAPGEAVAYYTANASTAASPSAEARLKPVAGLFNAALAMGRINDAGTHLRVMEGYLSEIGEDKDSTRILLVLDSRRRFHAASGNWAAAYSAQARADSIRARLQEDRAQSLDALISALTYSRLYKFRSDIRLYRQDLENSRASARKNIFIFSLIALVILLFALVVWYSYRNRSRALQAEVAQHQQEADLRRVKLELSEANLRNQQLESERTARELEYRKRDLADLALYLGRLKGMYESMTSRLSELKSLPAGDQKESLRKLTAEVSAQIQSQEKTVVLQENVEAVSKEFNDKLLRLFPELTRSEIEFCGLLRLNMSNKEIGILKNISPDSAKMARYRLRKKLHLHPEADIYKFLADI